MQKKFIFSFLFYGIFFCMTFFLSSCTLLDMVRDVWHEDDPLPLASPYEAVNTGCHTSSPQFQAAAADRMVTDFSMLLVMNSLSGAAVSGVKTAGESRGEASPDPRQSRTLQWGNEVLAKLLHAELLVFSPSSGNYLKSTISNNKWVLSFCKEEKELFSCSTPVSAAPAAPAE